MRKRRGTCGKGRKKEYVENDGGDEPNEYGTAGAQDQKQPEALMQSVSLKGPDALDLELRSETWAYELTR